MSCGQGQLAWLIFSSATGRTCPGSQGWSCSPSYSCSWRPKACWSPPGIHVVQLPKQGPLPAAAVPHTPASNGSPLSAASTMQRWAQCSHVPFHCLIMVSSLPALQPLHRSGLPARSARPPMRYLFSHTHLWCPQLGGSRGKMTNSFPSISSLFLYFIAIFNHQPISSLFT